MKNVVIAVAGTNGKREYKDVSILPGTKSRDVLLKLDLTGFEVTTPDGGVFAFNDELYPAAANGQKLCETAGKVEAGLTSA